MLQTVYYFRDFTCHLSLRSKDIATDPPPANSYTMHSRLVYKDPKTRKIFKTKFFMKRQNGQKCLEVCQFNLSLRLIIF